MRAAVFLDRDGTIVRERGYITRREQLRLLPGVGTALRSMARRGFVLVMVTNQSAIAQGLLSEPQLAALHEELSRRLTLKGVRLDGIYVCPHHPRRGSAPFRRRCHCRKPAPGLLRRAARDLGIDLRQSFVVGDSLRDIEAARRAGAMPILVRTGFGAGIEEEVRGRYPGIDVVNDLSAAARIIGARLAARGARCVAS